MHTAQLSMAIPPGRQNKYYHKLGSKQAHYMIHWYLVLALNGHGTGNQHHPMSRHGSGKHLLLSLTSTMLSPWHNHRVTGRFTDKPVCLQDVLLTRRFTENSPDECTCQMLLLSCHLVCEWSRWIMLSAKWLVSELLCQRNVHEATIATVQPDDVINVKQHQTTEDPRTSTSNSESTSDCHHIYY